MRTRAWELLVVSSLCGCASSQPPAWTLADSAYAQVPSQPGRVCEHPQPPARPEPPDPPVEARRPDDPIEAVRDARRTRAAPRAAALVAVEVQQLESLLGATPASARDRPMLLRRLAEDCVELEHGSAGPRAQSEARRNAIRFYTALVDDHSGSPASEYPLLDEVQYYLACEYERAGDEASARRRYLDLVTTAPGSRYVPLAYLAFGEMFRREGEADPSKVSMAEAAYQKVVSYPPPANVAFGWAWLRLGQMADARGDATMARRAYATVARFAIAYPQLPGTDAVAAAIPGGARDSSAPGDG